MLSTSLQGSYQKLTPAGTRCGKEGTPDQPWPRRCYQNDVITRSDCETDCDQYSWCIAYTHQESKKRCFLFNSEETGSCPSGYVESNDENAPTITSIDQITGVDIPWIKTSACYGKPTGKK